MGAVEKVRAQGAGVRGRTLAAALGQRGVRVDVVQAAGPDAVLGVGSSQPDHALAALAALGAREQCLTVGLPCGPLSIRDRAAAQLAAVPPAERVHPKASDDTTSPPLCTGLLSRAAEDPGGRIRTGATAPESCPTPATPEFP